MIVLQSEVDVQYASSEAVQEEESLRKKREEANKKELQVCFYSFGLLLWQYLSFAAKNASACKCAKALACVQSFDPTIRSKLVP